MASKCRNIWDTLRGDVATTCSPTHSCHSDAVSAGPSKCQTELRPMASNSSRRNCDVRGGKTDQKCRHDASKTSEVSRLSLNTGSAVLETACLHPGNKKSSTVNSTASNSAKTVAAARSVSANFSKTPLHASIHATCNTGRESSARNSRLSEHRRDTNIRAIASVSKKAGGVQERLSTNRSKAFQERALEFPSETNSHSVQSSLFKASSVYAASVRERTRQSGAHSGSDLRKAKYSLIKSQSGVTEFPPKNDISDFGSVGADLGNGVGMATDALSFFDHLPVPDVVLSVSQSNRYTAQTKPKQMTIRNDHDTNSVNDSLTDVTQRLSQTATTPVLRSDYLLDNFKCRSPDVDIEVESLSDAGQIPLFSSPFNAATVNYDYNVDSSLSVCRGSMLAKVSRPKDVCSGVCDLVSCANCSNISLGHISRFPDVFESESNSYVTDEVILAKERNYTDGKAFKRFANDGASVKGSEGDATVGAYAVMLGDNAYSKLQYFYTSSKNSDSLSYPVSKSDSESFPDCCDEGFVESPMTTDDTMESTNDADAERILQIPTMVSDSSMYESANMLTDAFLEADVVQETNVRRIPDQNGQIEPFTSKFHDHDFLRGNSESVERIPAIKSDDVELCANNVLMETNQSSHSATDLIDGSYPPMSVTDRPCDSVKNLDGPYIKRECCSQKMDDILSSDIDTNYVPVRGGGCDRSHSSNESSFEDKSSDIFSERSRSRSEEEPADCKTEGFGDYANESKRKTSRRPRMLNEIANTVGFIADKRQNQHSDSLFIDSKLLTREERVLQMVHMQMTKMEVKEELTKLKKTKSLSETMDQDIKSECGEPASDHRFPTTPCHQARRRIKATVGRTLTSHRLLVQRQTGCNKRIRPNVWSPRAVRFAELRGTTTFKKGAKQPWDKRGKSTISGTVLQAGNGGRFHLLDSPTGAGSEFRGRRRAMIEYKGAGAKFSVGRAFPEHFTSRAFTSDGRPLSNCDSDATRRRMNGCSDELAPVIKTETVSDNVHQYSSASEWSQVHATPVVPLEVKRLIACHNTGETVLHKAARLGYPDIVLWCCQSRYIDIDTTDNAGYTPLHESCIGSEVSIARYLLHYGANINVTSGVDGRRPIHEAVDSDSLEMVRLLLSAGADVNLTTYSGKTVQDLAKSAKMKDFLKAYVGDLNDVKDGDKEVVWDLAPVWNGGSDECGMDLFCDLPTCDPKSEEFYVECSNRPL